jgi:hypothetical protein
MHGPRCQAENPAGTRFCGNCGKPLNEAEAPPSPTRTLAFLSPQ